MNSTETITGGTGNVAQAQQQLERNILTRMADGTWQALQGYATTIGPGDIARQIVANVAYAAEWLSDLYRHERVLFAVRDGDVDENGNLIDRGAVEFELRGFCEYFQHKAKLIEMLREKLEKLAELELVRETAGGQGILASVAVLTSAVDEADLWWGKGDELVTRIVAEPELEPDQQLRLECARYRVEALEIAGKVNDKLHSTQASCADALDVEAIRAIVTDPDNDRYQTYQKDTTFALNLVNHGLGVADTLGGALGEEPEPYAQAAAMGIHVVVSVLKVLKVGLDRITMSIAVNRDLQKYIAAEPLGAEFARHNDDPLLIAKMLGDKRVRDVETILSLVADPLVRELRELCPAQSVADAVWKAVRDAIIGLMRNDQDRRIELARERLTAAPAEAATGWASVPLVRAALVLADHGVQFGKDALDEVKGSLESNICDVLEPWQLGTNAVIHGLAGRITRLVVNTLPPNPAQDINGNALYAHLQDILGLVRQQVTIQTRPAPQAVAICPPWTEDGRVVLAVLSGERKGERNGMPCWLVRLDDGTIGTLYELEGMFDHNDDLGVTTDDLPPDRDDAGVVLSQVDVPSKTVTEEPDGTRVTSYRARVGAVQGHLRQRGQGNSGVWAFVIDSARPVAASAFTDWSRRFIQYPPGDRGSGYEDRLTGEFVPGTWYKPIEGRYYYLFIGETGIVEWALGADLAGNLPNTPVLKVLESLSHDASADLSVLLPRLN